MVVRLPTGYRDGLRVVAAIARLPDDEPVLRWAAEFAAGQSDQLMLVHALPGAFDQRILGSAGSGAGPTVPDG